MNPYEPPQAQLPKAKPIDWFYPLLTLATLLIVAAELFVFVTLLHLILSSK